MTPGKARVNEGACSIPRCGKQAKSKGWCLAHYEKWRRYGDPLIVHRQLGSLAERLLAGIEVDPESLCWVWTKARTSGYGTLRFESRNGQVHRFAHELWIGPIPSGFEVDHTCHDPRWCAGGDTCPHRACLNPDHLLAVAPAVNSHPSRRRSGLAPKGSDAHALVQQALYRLAVDRGFVGLAAEGLGEDASDAAVRQAIGAALLA